MQTLKEVSQAVEEIASSANIQAEEMQTGVIRADEVGKLVEQSRQDMQRLEELADTVDQMKMKVSLS